MKRFYKILTLALAAVMLLGIISVPASAASDPNGSHTGARIERNKETNKQNNDKN